MSGYDYEEETVSEEEVIEDVLGENPRARELRLMRSALEMRLAGFTRELVRTKDEKEKRGLETKIAELKKQIEVIHKEEAITTFVEDSVRVTLIRGELEDQ